MKYKTIIELVTDANDENEAIDIAGDYLRGDINDGVEINCYAKPFKCVKLFKFSVFLGFISLLMGMVSLGYMKSNYTHNTSSENVFAVQPPLRTQERTEFKDSWEKTQNTKALDYIKN